MTIAPVANYAVGPVSSGRARPDLAQSMMQAALNMEVAQADAQHSLASPRSPVEAHLSIRLDEGTQRFVQTLIDPATDAVLRRFPDEGQLTFSRGIAAYEKASRAA